MEITDWNVVIDERSLYDQTVKSDLRTYDNIRKNSIGQTGGYITSCLLDYPYFKNCSKLIAIDKIFKI